MSVREVVVTGATGFVGGHVIAALAERGAGIRAIVRATSATAGLREYGVDPVVASLDDAAALREAVSGADVVIHLAALTHAKTEEELRRVNEGGTASLVRASLEAEVKPKRFIYLSSLAALGPSAGKRLGSDDTPSPLTAYGRTKLAGEAALSRHGSAIEAVTLRAPAVYGPGDRELLRFFRMARLGLLPLPSGPDRPLQLVHVQDLARGIAMAAMHDSLQGTFNVADPEARAFRDVCRMIGDAVGTTPMILPVPQAAIAAAAGVSEMFSRMSGRSTMFNRDKVREILAPGWLCETQTAQDAFGFRTEIPLAEGLQSTAGWYRTKGWL